MKRVLVLALAGATLAAMPNSALANHRHLARHPDLGAYPSVPACASPDAVCSAGTYVGSDPNPQVRAQMLTDYNRGVYGLGNR
jgi:hypothetical protein